LRRCPLIAVIAVRNALACDLLRLGERAYCGSEEIM
jgi:hypothetical protein